jgi:H+/Cl- antiporter ClcA
MENHKPVFYACAAGWLACAAIAFGIFLPELDCEFVYSSHRSHVVSCAVLSVIGGPVGIVMSLGMTGLNHGFRYGPSCRFREEPDGKR